MQSSSIAPWHPCCCYPVPKHLFSPNLNAPNQKNFSVKPLRNLSINNSVFTFTATNNCAKGQEKNQNLYEPDRENPELDQDFCFFGDSQETQFRETGRDPEDEIDSLLEVSSNMWWKDFKAFLGQRINVEGLTSSVGILSKDKHLAIPHVSVPDIRYVDWAELKKSGFKGVVFDKDNTISLPYSLNLCPPLASSIEQCKSLFGDNVAVFSNSAGLFEYDPDGRKAGALEDAIGIKVIRHRLKKPAGSAEEIEKHFGSESSRLVMVGDRPFTDIVYGNRNGFFTILTEPLNLAGEPLIVKQVRLLEVALVNRWCGEGLKAINHSLLPDPLKCVRDIPL